MVPRYLTFLLILLCSGYGALAQNITGTITGTVEDPSGGLIPAAQVIALNENTGLSYRTTSTDAGVYVLPLLPLGNYRLTVEVQGFKKFVRGGLSLGGDQRLRVDARLEVGSVSESVEVTSAPSLIQTDQSTIGGSFTPITFDNLPIGRNVLATVGLLPGVEGGVAGHFQGSRANRTDYKVDGISAATTNLGYIRIQPVADLVEEVVVQTSNYSAELGRGTGQVSVTTRAGTNKFHGVLFHYFQNDVLNANGFMPNVYGTQKPVKRYNLFGGTINGPVVLPKIYDGHNRTFFTFAYEGIQPINYQQAVSSVPTSAMRAGDFTGQPVIYDPATTAPNASGSGYVRTPFAGNRIPSARMDPVSMNILKAGFPEANLPGTANNYFNSGSARNPVKTYNVRGDHDFSSANRVSGRYLDYRETNNGFMPFPTPAGGRKGDSYDAQFKRQVRRVVSIDHTYVIRPNLINNLRFGHHYDYSPKWGPGTNEDWPSKLGVKNVAQDKFPTVAVTGLDQLGNINLADQRPGFVIELADSLALIKGRHSVKLGFEYRNMRSFFWQPGNSSGSFTFNTLPTMNPADQRQGHGVASLLLGLSSNSAVVLYPKEGFTTVWSYYAGYAQDDIRLSKKLTLNLGVRWETTSPRKEANNWQSNFNLATLENDYAGLQGYPSTLYDFNRKEFAPRVGFAYTPFGDNRTVIRGGYGIFYMPMNSTGDGALHNGPWRRSYNWISPDNGITFPLTMQQGLPRTSFDDPYVLSPTTAAQWVPRSYPDAYMQEWSFNVQREVFARTMIEAGYVGTKGTFLQNQYQLNQVPSDKLGPGNAQLRRPYPTRGDITAYQSPVGNSTYHSMQIRFDRRLQKGFGLQGSYTFSKSIDDEGSPQDNFNMRLEKSVSAWNPRHSLSYAFTWELPVGKGRNLLSSGGVVEKFVGGWNVSVLSSVSSGSPLSMGSITNLSGSLGGGSRPNRLRNGALPGEERNRLRWFDASAYALPDPFKFGNTSRTEPGLLGPGAVSLDLLLAKEFRFTESMKLQLRSEFYNAMNHFNPGKPNATIGNAAVGTITGGSGGRTIQISMKLHF